MRIWFKIDDPIGGLDMIFLKPQSESIDILAKFAPLNRWCMVDLGTQPSGATCMLACSVAESVVERAVHCRCYRLGVFTFERSR